MSRPKLWTKNFILICGINFFTHIVFYSLLATVSQYVMSHFGRSQSEAGLAVGIFVLTALIARLFAGKIVDTMGQKRILIISAVTFLFAILSYQLVETYIIFLIVRGIHGFAFGFLMTATSAIMANIVPDERRGAGTGYYATAMNIAMAIGPFIGLFMLQISTFNMFIFVLSVVALCNLLCIFLSVPPTNRSQEKQKVQFTFKISDMLEKRALPIAICMFTLAIGYSSLISFVSPYIEEGGFGKVALYFFVVYAMALIVTRPFTGRLFDRFGENRITYPMLIILVIGYFVLSQATSSGMILLASALIGIGYGTVQSNYLAIAIKEALQHQKATATSTYFILMDLAIGIGPYLYGIILTYMSYKSMYSWTVAWFILAIGIYYLLHGKKAKERHMMKEITL